jgi:hypothetical protein
MTFWDVTSHTNANILEKPAVSIFRIKEKYRLGLLDSVVFTSVDAAYNILTTRDLRLSQEWRQLFSMKLQSATSQNTMIFNSEILITK